MSEQEKRVDQRHNLELAIKVRWSDPAGNTCETAGTTINISPSGALIVCDTHIDQNAPIDLDVNLPVTLGGTLTSSVSARAKVVRDVIGSAGGYEHGIRFNHFSFTRL
jgi:hypothetical protein